MSGLSDLEIIARRYLVDQKKSIGEFIEEIESLEGIDPLEKYRIIEFMKTLRDSFIKILKSKELSSDFMENLEKDRDQHFRQSIMEGKEPVVPPFIG